MRPGAAVAAVLLLLLSTASGRPGRHLEYAESENRLVYAFVFGSRDTCRVYRRSEAPRIPLDAYLRRPPGANFKGEPGDQLLKEFDFARIGRPVHLIPSNDGEHLLTFANRAPDGSVPTHDAVWFLKDKGLRSDDIDYSLLPRSDSPSWPRLERALARQKADPPPAVPPSYAFGSREPAPGRFLVARQSEGEGRLEEMVCFLLALPQAKARLPEESELLSLLREDDPLFRGAAAWGLCHVGNREHVPALKGALARSTSGAVRAALAHAIVRLGDDTGRRTLRALLQDGQDAVGRRAAALALASLPPSRADGEALATIVGDLDRDTARFAGIALVRLEGHGVAMAIRVSRSTRKELRAAAAGLLGRMDDVKAEERLLRLVGDPEPDVQIAAARALTRPPRAILPENHIEFARALDACRQKRNAPAASRLAKLAAHAKIHHEKVLEALVDLSPFHGQAIRSLSLLSGESLTTADQCRAWWESRGGK